jgi:hypothetical protein
MISKKELQEDNEDLVELLGDLLDCAEDQGIVLPIDLSERIAEFIELDEEREEAEVIDIKPVS